MHIRVTIRVLLMLAVLVGVHTAVNAEAQTAQNDLDIITPLQQQARNGDMAARAQLSAKASKGNLHARYLLARLMLEQSPADTPSSEALRLLSDLALVQDYTEAQTFVGMSLLINQDPEISQRGVRLLMRAAAKGQSEAQLTLASLLVEETLEEGEAGLALRLAFSAANQGQVEALYLLGRLREEGRLMQGDLEEAWNWYTAAILRATPERAALYRERRAQLNTLLSDRQKRRAERTAAAWHPNESLVWRTDE